MTHNLRGHCFEAEDVSPGQPTDAMVALEMITKLVMERYRTDSSQHQPMIFAFSEGQVSTIIQLDFTSDIGKNESIQTAKRQLLAMGCDASVFVSEGWGLKQPSLLERPSQSPKRVEMLLVEASAPGRFVSTIHDMIRHPSGIVSFNEYQRTDSLQLGGTDVLKTKFDFFNQGRA